MRTLAATLLLVCLSFVSTAHAGDPSEPIEPDGATQSAVMSGVPFCVAGCYTETQCAADTGLSVTACKDCLVFLADSGKIHSCLPFAQGFCRFPAP